MRIIVCVKQVPGTNQVEIDDVTGVLKREGVGAKMNPYDLYAIETAVRIKETQGGTVSALSMGPMQAEAVLREAIMMGIDEAVLLTDRKFSGSDVLATSYTLAQGIKKIGVPDLLLCGKMTTDGDTAQVGPAIAEFLNIPHITNVKAILEIREDGMVVEMDLLHAVGVADILFPCLITIEKDGVQPRLPSYRRKLAMQDVKISRYGISDMEDQNENHYGLEGSPTKVVRIFSPAANTDYEKWHGSSEELSTMLLQKLKQMKHL
jgi:electron transfer flavoprotein beta subunit